MSELSSLATFDDIRRCINVLTDGTAEMEFLRMLSVQEKTRCDYDSAVGEAQRIQKELDASLQSMADLETKLFHARRLLEIESKARRDAEHDRDQLERKMVAVADMLQHERNLKDETKDKLAFLHTLPRKRKSLGRNVEEKYGNDINSTGSFLSDLSITQSEDDFLDVGKSGNWQKHRPSLPKNGAPCVGSKRSHLNVNGDTAAFGTPPQSVPRRSTRRSGGGSQKQKFDMAAGVERICATTKVTIPQDGNGVIRAESTIESTPLHTTKQLVERIGDGPPPRLSLTKEPSAPPMTPVVSKTPLPAHCSAANSPGQAFRPPMQRQHNFTLKTFLSTDNCNTCQKKIRFGSVGLRCRNCSVRCHSDCRYLLKVSCVPQSGTPTTKGLMGYITDYAPAVPPLIPALIVHCVNEIEMRGLDEVGIYRVSGSEREVKSLKERFLRGKGTPHLGNTDIHVLSGCIKDFLRSLQEPLVPTSMWKDFCNAVQNPNEMEIQKDLYKTIAALPPANRDTLAFMVLHLQRIANCPVVCMPIDNLARVFGPTIVGYSSIDADSHAIFAEVYTQCNVMQNLLKLPTEYWTQFVAIDLDKENVSTNADALTPTNKESIYSLYATPLKSTLKKRKFFGTPPHPHKK